MFENIAKAYEYIRTQTDFVPDIAVTLGSGLGEIADEAEPVCTINYRDIPGFPISTVAGHKGRFSFCKIGGKNVAFMQGRVHYYEGYGMKDVVMPLRVLHKMGTKTLMLTNAAGGVNYTFEPGDFMIIRDHISCFVPSPLIGENYPDGTRFPDMSNVYDKKLSDMLYSAAAELGISVREGVYMQLSGPNYEAPTEVRMCRMLGADAVGMSTACEAMAAVHCGMKVCGISCITNMAAGMSLKPLSHDEVKEIADLKAPQLRKLILEGIKRS